MEVFIIEQLNIVGKRSGKGFVTHKAVLIKALSRALSARVVLLDITLGLKGLLGYLKALGGSNVVKVIPCGSAGGEQATDKRLKVICGANVSLLGDTQWLGDNTPMTLCEVRVHPSNSVIPNIGAGELAEAIGRVLPFVSSEEERPLLNCVYFTAKEGKLTLVATDSFSLSEVRLDLDTVEGEALIDRGDLAGIASALKSAKRARISFNGEEIKTLTIDTELIRYKWVSVEGKYPDHEKLIPTDYTCLAHFDTLEAIKAVSSLKALSDVKDGAIDLTLADGKITLADPDDRGQADIVADIEGDSFVRLNTSNLIKALKACSGMADFQLSSPLSPVLFSQNGQRVVVMPMLTDKAKGYGQKAKQEAEAKAEQAEPVAKSYEVRGDTGKKPEPVSPVAKKPVKQAKEPVKAKK